MRLHLSVKMAERNIDSDDFALSQDVKDGSNVQGAPPIFHSTFHDDFRFRPKNQLLVYPQIEWAFLTWDPEP